MSIVVNKTRLPVTNWQTKSGAIVSIDDARQRDARSLKVHMNPIQDLHGYDNPWPAGGGKNKIIPLAETKSVNGTTVECSAASETIKITGTASGNGGRGIPLTPYIKLSAGSYVLSVTGTHQGSFIVNKRDATYISSSTFTLSEETEIFVGVNVVTGTVYDETVQIQIESGSTSTAWQPYSNVCPISGYQSVAGYRTGANLLEEDAIASSGSQHDIDYVVNADGSITVSGTATANVTMQVMSKRDLPEGTYTVSGVPANSGGAGLRLWARDNNRYFSSVNGANDKGVLSNQVYSYITISNGTALSSPVTIYPQLELGSSASSYSPYTGTTYPVSFPAVGKNQFDKERMSKASEYHILFNSYMYSDPIYLKPNTAYVMSPTSTTNLGVSDYYGLVHNGVDSDDKSQWNVTNADIKYPVNAGTPRTVTFTTNASGIIRFAVVRTGGDVPKESALTAFMSINYQLEEGSSATSYEPYTTTVYSGTVDLVSGELVLTWKEINLGSMGWIKRASYFQSDNLADAKTYSSYYAAIDAICSSYKIGTVNSTPQNNGSICVTINSGRLLLRDDSLFDLDATAFASAVNGVQYVYELATPITYHLTPQQIQMLVRNNTIWSDADSVEVEYAAVHAH